MGRLVLSRHVGERIRINDHIIIEVVRIGPEQVRLSFDAPRSVSIVREELCGEVLENPLSKFLGVK